MKTNKWTKILVATGCCVFAMGAGFMNLTATAKAEDKTLGGVTVSSFAMDDGAWVRKDTTKETTGLRFVARMAKTSYDSLEALEANGASVDYGMLIVPADYSAELTEETVFGASASYCLEEKTATHTATCNKKHITQVLAEKLAIDGEEAVLRGALVNLKSQNVNREFVGRAYAAYTVDGKTEYVFADYTNGVKENNVRSMTYVAQKYLNANGSDESGMMYDTYIKPLVNYQHKYTVEHYLPDGTKLVEEKWGTLNGSVSAANIAKTELNDGTYDVYATALCVKDESVPSDVLYANGKTVLKCYYQNPANVSNVLFSAADAADVEKLRQANADDGELNRLTDKTSVTTVADPTDASKTVVKVTSIDQNEWRDGILDMNFDETKLKAAADANWDYLTVRMYIKATPTLSGIYTTLTEDSADYTAEVNKITQVGSVGLFSNNIMIARCNLNEWVDVVIPKAKLQGVEESLASELFGKGQLATKAQFDEAFANAFSGNGSKYLFYIGDFATTEVANLKNYAPMKNGYALSTKGCHDVEISYYIDTITWGVDYKAPEILSVDARAFSDTEEVTYTPSYTVGADDILPGALTAQNGRVHPCIVKSSHILYQVGENDVRTVVEANADGSYTLNKNNNYVLSVSAWDWSVTDIPGNITTKEYPLVIASADKTTVDFSKSTETIYVETANSVINNKEHLEEFDGHEGVLKLETSLLAGQNYGADLRLNYTEGEADNIWKAFNSNANFKFSITIRFDFGKIHSGNYGAFGVNFYGGSVGYLGGNPELMMVTTKDADGNFVVKDSKMAVENWYTITFTKEILQTYCGWTSEAQVKKELTGQDYFIRPGGNMSVNITDAGTPVTYYIDEISYSVS